MSKRTRGLTRHIYTVIRKDYDDYIYKRGEGQLVPLNRPKSSLEPVADLQRLEIEAELELHTRQDFPVIDPSVYTNEGGRFTGIGKSVDPDYVMFKGSPFTTIGINYWENNGQSSYRRCYLIYTSAEENIVNDRAFYEVDWSNLSQFEQAVDGVEFMNTLVLSKVIN